MKHRVVTISREFGSGGRTIGRELAARLGIPCYDEEVIEKLSERSGYSKEYIKERGEYAPAATWIGSALAGRDRNGYSVADSLWRVQSDLIQELAEQSPCVIVGRCADYLLRDRADCLTVFIHASMEFRAKRIVEVYGQREESPEKRLRDKDRRRRAYYQLYTDTRWGEADNYHIALDSGVLGIGKCVDILADLYRNGKENGKLFGS